MNKLNTTLPAGFESLEPFVDSWAVPTAQDRTNRRLMSTSEERTAFATAVRDLVPDALKLLDSKPLRELDDSEQRLMKLLLTFTHIAQAVDVQKDAEPRHASMRRHFTITRAPADELPA